MFGDEPGPHLQRVDAVGRQQRGDGARLARRTRRPASRRTSASTVRVWPPTSAEPGLDVSRPRRDVLTERDRKTNVGSDVRLGVGQAAAWRCVGQQSGPGGEQPTPRGPAVHLRDDVYIASAPMSAQSRCAKAWAASTTRGMPSPRHTAAISAGGLHDAAVTAQHREVHQRRRVGGEAAGRGVEGRAGPSPSAGSGADVKAVACHDHEIRAVLTGQAGDLLVARQIAQQYVERVVGARW